MGEKTVKTGTVLTILISTFNRCELVQRNITKMLENKSSDVQFIVCDNGSTDGTWTWMQTINDERVTILHNDFNYGFENFWLISEYVQSKYFMFVNDRDYIRPVEIEMLCEMLKEIDDCDFISNERRNCSEGYYGWKDALKIYFQSRHPGTLIYNTEFSNKYIDKATIRKYLENGKAEKANNYLVFQILLNVSKVYVNARNPINQPLNRERIPKVRVEYYKVPYMSLEYRSREYDDWIKEGIRLLDNPRIREIMLAIYRDSIMTVTWEYYFSMKIPGMARRNSFENHSANEWIYNGALFYLHVLRNKKFRKFGLLSQITKITVENYRETIRKVMEW